VLFRFAPSSPELFLQRIKDLMAAEEHIGFRMAFST
jgi:hypothetical protein